MNASVPYLLDNAQAHAAQRMRILAELFDAPTRRALTTVGVSDGWCCLEVGGGGGGVARWLAERVGPTGSVLCTDLDPRHIDAQELPNLRIERHDIVTDPLPAGHFDLIHARLVLLHIPERAAVLERLVQALKPGGWIVIEDFDAVSMLPDSALYPCELELAASGAMRRFMRGGGVDARFGRTLYGRFRALGLAQVSAEGRVSMFDRHNGGADLMRVNFEQIGAQLVAAGFISGEQLRADIAQLDSPDYAAPSPVMWTVAGRNGDGSVIEAGSARASDSA
jgi:SAM-dependent methyltransferase